MLRVARGRTLVVALAVVSLAALVVPAKAGPGARDDGGAITLSTPFSSPAGDLPAGPRQNGTAVLPDGRLLTPVGLQLPVELQPLNGVLSADGRRLYVSSEGINDDPNPDPTAPSEHHRDLTVIDTSNGNRTRINDDALHYGMAESRDGSTLYISEGKTGSIGVFHRTPPADDNQAPGDYVKLRSIPLGSSTDYPWGLALKDDRLYVVGFESDTLSTIDVSSQTVVSRVSTGNYPYAVTVSPDGQRVYVSNWGLYNQAADSLNPIGKRSPLGTPPLTIGGYNTASSSSVWTYSVSSSSPTPVVDAETPIGLPLNGADVVSGSLPSALALSSDGHRLAVTSSNDDLVQILDTTTSTTTASGGPGRHPSTTIDLHVLEGGPTGAQPDGVAWTNRDSRLLVAEAGRNSVAVVDTTALSYDGAPPSRASDVTGRNRSSVLGRLPTALYPTGVVTSADAQHLYVVNNMGLGSGPNDVLLPDGPAKVSSSPDVAYIPNTLHGSVQSVDLPWALGDLAQLTSLSDADNGLVPADTGRGTVSGDGSVVPTHYGAGPSPVIKHVFLIIKENRPYDQVLGDVPGTERMEKLTTFGQKITPNTHALAKQFSFSDNFYANSSTSVDGHYGIDTGQMNEFVLKTTPSSYAGKFSFDTYQTQPENLPEGGLIWDNAGAHGVVTRIYGEGTYVVGLPPQQLGKIVDSDASDQLVPGVKASNVSYDPTYPSQVDLTGSVTNAAPAPLRDPLAMAANTVFPFNDEGRATSFKRSMAAFRTAGVMPQLNVMLLFDDHTAGYLPNAHSPEDYVAENDHALGEIVDEISHSPFWSSSAIFATEDDTQGGVDHVDAHRTVDLVISPWAKKGVKHTHESFSSMIKTIDLMLGLPPTSTIEMTATSLARDFIDAGGSPDMTPYEVRPNTTFPVTNPVPAAAANPMQATAAELGMEIPTGIDKGGSEAPLDLFIGHDGALAAGDPNVVDPVDVYERALSAYEDPTPAPVQPGQTSPWW